MGSAFSLTPCVFNHGSSNTKMGTREDKSYKKHRETVQLVILEDQMYLHMFPVLESEDTDRVEFTTLDRNFGPKKKTLKKSFSMSEYQEELSISSEEENEYGEKLQVQAQVHSKPNQDV